MRKRTVKILTGFAVFVVSLAAVYAVAVGISALKLRRAYAALAEDGRPMKMADLLLPGVSDTENAALLYESAILLLQAQPAGRYGLLSHLGDLSYKYVNGTLDPNQQPEFRELMELDVVANALQIVEQGTTRPASRLNITYSQRGNRLPSPDSIGLRSLTRILDARTALEIEGGRGEQAWGMAITQLRFADALRTESSYVFHQLMRVVQINTACRTIRRLCESSLPNDREYRLLETLLADCDDITPLAPAVDAERLEGERTFNLPKDELWQESQQIVFGRSYEPEFFLRLRFYKFTFKPLLLADHAAYLRVMHGYAKVLEQPYEPDATERLNRLYDEIARGHTLAERLAPGMVRVREFYLYMIAETRMTRAGLALLRYQDDHGAFPQSLDVLGLDYAQDPFSQASLIYRPEGDGFVLYSVGPNGEDNGGTPRERDRPEYDIVWQFSRPMD